MNNTSQLISKLQVIINFTQVETIVQQVLSNLKKTANNPDTFFVFLFPE
jgi:hypothetical protein